jgi:hypothetical protein
MSDWSALFWLIVVFLIMYPLKRWISAHVQGVAFLLTGNAQVAVWLFWALFLPGTVLHELSHWITATLLRVKTGQFSLWPKLKKKGELQMGSLQVEVADPFRYSLIGLAPLIFGSVAVLVIGQGRLELGQLGQAISTGNLDAISRAVVRTLSVADVWLWLYLLFAVSNAMLPSESDRQAWRTVLIYLGLALVLALGLGFNPTVSPEWQDFILTIVRYLLTAFLITVAVDLFFILLIMLVENTLAGILGRRVEYNR